MAASSGWFLNQSEGTQLVTNLTAPRPLARNELRGQGSLELAASAISIGVCLLALSSRSSKQIRFLRTEVSFWSSRLVQLLVVACALAAVLVVVPLLAVLALYRLMVGAWLGRGLLCGSDAVWALDALSKSREVVNVLAVLDGHLSLSELREIVRKRLVPASAKLSLQRRYSLLGYFYWQPKKVDVSAHVRLLSGGEEATEDELRALVAAASNSPLPEGHTAGWEVLLGPRLPAGRTPLLFRVHHSLGDGPALCRLLLNAIADPHEQPGEDLLTSLQARQKRQHSSLLETLKDATAGLAAQASLPPDLNCLHGPVLSGHKQLSWRGSSALLDAARRVRAATGAPFSAGLLAALAGAVAEREGRGGRPLTVVVPARTPGQAAVELELDNSFSFALVQLTLPDVSTGALARVRAAEAALRAASRPATLLTNSWALQLAGGLLPRPLAAQALHSGQCTAVMSNMPGPPHQLSLAGRPLSSLAFWVPHRGTTGVGASALSYAGQLTLGLTVDGALLKGPEDAHLLTLAWERHLLELEKTLAPQ